MLFVLILILLTPILFVLYLEIKNYSKVKIVNKLPGPPALPIVGNGHQMGKTPSEILSQLFQWWVEADHQNYRLLIGPYRNVIVSDAKDLEFILTSKTLIDKSDIYDMFHPWLGLGLLTSTGKRWFARRKMITPSFHFKILQDFHESMNKNSTKFIEKLREVSHSDSIFDFQDMAHYLTLDVIAETAMGVQINAMDNNDDKVVIAKRIESLNRKEGQLLEGEDDGVSSKRKLAFLDTLLSATTDGQPLTQEDIYEEVSTFMFEGHDTTTSGIVFAIYVLSIFPEIQKKVYEEQKQLLSDNIKGDATFQQVAEMQYLDLFIKEVLRVYPSVPFIGRNADKEYDINGTIIPEGTTINLFLMALGYNEKYFPDPYRFDPDRWLNEKCPQNPFQYVPFSAGVRNCIGQKFALLELKTVVSKIVRSFEILPPLDELISKDGYTCHFLGLSAEEQKKRLPNPSKYVPVLSAVLILKSANGIYLRLRERV